MVAYWMLDRKSIDFPFDAGTSESINQAWDALNDPLNAKLGLDFTKFDSPSSLIAFVRHIQETGGVRTRFNPDSEPTFSNRKSLGSGIVVYQVENSKAGQKAVRKALDDAWGINFNGWCLASRKSKYGRNQAKLFNNLTDEQKNELGFYSDDELAVSWNSYWTRYDVMPKRVAFRNGKIFAFSASEERFKIYWWDKHDDEWNEIPYLENVHDDPEFVKKYGSFNFISDPYYDKTDSQMIDEMARIANDENDDSDIAQAELARLPNLPASIARMLAHSDDDFVRYTIAENKSTPPDILVMLSTDKDYMVRSATACNPGTPANALAKLACDNDDIRWEVADNPNTPIDVLKKLANDKKEYVKGAALSNLNAKASHAV